jgi:hypothetical protein
MSENKWTEIRLDELCTIRLVCQHQVSIDNQRTECGAIIEIPLDKLAYVRQCSMCGNLLHVPADDRLGEIDPFKQLGRVLAALVNLKTAKVSFVVKS